MLSNIQAELLVFENYSHSSFPLSSKDNIGHIFFKKAKDQVYMYSWDYTINHNENEYENEK